MTQTCPTPAATPSCNGRIAFIQSGWHVEIVDECRIGFLEELARLGLPESQVDRFEVPGAFEIPLHAKLLAKSGRYAGIVAAGFVIDGGIYRHEFVAQSVISGLMQVQLETETPVFSAVLTPHHFHDHPAQKRFFHDHFRIKGAEAAQACVATLAGVSRLRAAA